MTVETDLACSLHFKLKVYRLLSFKNLFNENPLFFVKKSQHSVIYQLSYVLVQSGRRM